VLTILDRYIIRSFLYSYLVCAVALLGLTMVLDAFLRIKEFMDAAYTPGAPGFGMLSVMLQYYSVRLPVFFQMISPAILLTAAMFCVGQLNKNNELVPMRASGISLFRTLAPLFLFGILLTALLVVNQELIVPAMVAKIKYTESLLEGRSNTVYDRLEIEDEMGNKWSIPRYEAGEERIKGTLHLVSYYRQEPRRRVIRTDITAESAKWKRTRSDGMARWHLSNGAESRHYSSGARIATEDGNYDSRFGEDGYIVLRPGEKTDDEFRLASNLRPIDMIPLHESVLYQSSAKLGELFARDPSRADIAVALSERYSFPLSNIVLLLLGLPFVLGTESKGTFSGLVTCVVICAAFYAVHAFCIELGNKSSLSPELAAWLPIALFGPLGIFLFDWVKT
jgi:lipopolysaccharide export system permease protein